jgi:hypothetical protein
MVPFLGGCLPESERPAFVEDVLLPAEQDGYRNVAAERLEKKISSVSIK